MIKVTTKMRPPRTNAQIAKATTRELREWYYALAQDYNALINHDYIICARCGLPKSAQTGFYLGEEYAIGHFPECKICVKEQVEQRKLTDDTKTPPNVTESTVKVMLRKMDKPFIRKLYESQVEKSKTIQLARSTSVWDMYYTALACLHQYDGLHWADSDKDDLECEDLNIDKDSDFVERATAHFGSHPLQDLQFLEKEYEDWINRYPCESKSQEVLYKRICWNQLNLEKAERAGKDTKELEKTLQSNMAALNIKPTQSNTDSLTQTQSFGQLIERWEQTKPIPEPEGDFKDVDKIGTYIEVFFKGHLAKMMNLKNAFSAAYDKFISAWTVNKPTYDEDSESDAIFSQIFGEDLEDK